MIAATGLGAQHPEGLKHGERIGLIQAVRTVRNPDRNGSNPGSRLESRIVTARQRRAGSSGFPVEDDFFPFS
jgi:hypothetical protein